VSLKRISRIAGYAWAAPYTACGLVVGVLVVLFGGTARREQGVLEIGGGLLGKALSRLPPRLGFGAITLGHVVLGLDHEMLATLRAHEQVHVRQYARWGPLFVPAYLLSSLWQALRGRRPYLDNHFEREAYAQAGE
jgi:hypothetical protein